MWYTLRKEEIIRKLETNEKTGLTQNQVEQKQKDIGKNVIIEGKSETIFTKFVKQFKDAMIIILIAASVISAIMSYVQGENNYIDSIIIIAIVIANALMGVIQESKAEKAIESLKQLTPPKAKVIRDGEIKTINAQELVPGDIVKLEAGNNVPADCRIIKCTNLKIEESSLTGENLPVEKQSEVINKTKIPLGDIHNMAFMGSNVITGHATAIVTETGMNTKVGQIANLMKNNETPETPIQKKLGEVGKILGIACLAICFIIFIIGIIKKINPIEMFMTSVGLAVAAIPEGLPAIVTIVLSIGVSKMAKQRSIIRKLPAVETLGSSSVICSDKTGTLTQNNMQVQKIYANSTKQILELAAMCNDCELQSLTKNKEPKIIGEPTETAIVREAIRQGIDKKQLYEEMPRIADIPFDSTRKMMTTIHKTSAGYRIITKGAPDVIFKHCTKIDINQAQKQNEEMAQNALRVIAVAYKDISGENIKITEDLEKNLKFVGLIGMIDPPRPGVKEAINTCKKAGIRTVMITGDHILTATAIAKEIGIIESKEDNVKHAITGEELDKLSDKQLEKTIKQYSVYARVTPEHKVRIVKAWQNTGAVVAMTGDGVNDSPALKKADIGIAMGKNGTDVAKNASDMILTDDNFVTIVEAIKEGRTIYDNIKKAIHFLIATNIGEIVTIFVGLILGLKAPLLAIQLLWINMVTDSFPAIALGLEQPEKEIMNRPPNKSNQGIFSDGLWSKIITEGIMIGMLTIVTFSIGIKYYGIEVARTMTFFALGTLELIHSFNIKSEQSILENSILENKYLVMSLIAGIIMQIVVIIIPQLAKIFELTTLTMQQWIITAVISILPIPIIEIQKSINKINEEKSYTKNNIVKRTKYNY